MSNQIIREQMKKTRRTLASEQPFQSGKLILEKLQTLDVFRRAKTLGLYFPHHHEVDCITTLSSDKKKYLPVLKLDQLEFAPYESQNALLKNRFGIPEPHTQERIAPTKLDLVLVPLVAFTRSGHRLGMGAGYYDKTFSFRLKTPAPPLLIGVGYDWQEVENLEIHEWDVPMDLIVTDQCIICPNA